MENYAIDYTASSKIRTIADFANLRTSTGRSVFVRLIGESRSFLSEVAMLDKSSGSYKRLQALPNGASAADMEEYITAYDRWEQSGRRRIVIRLSKEDAKLSNDLGRLCRELAQLFEKAYRSSSPSVEKSFIVKLLFRLDTVLCAADLNSGARLVGENVTKLQEYLFYYAAAQLGVSVLLLQHKADIDESARRLSLSQSCSIGAFGSAKLPPYAQKKKAQPKPAAPAPAPQRKTPQPAANPRLKVPPKPGRSTAPAAPSRTAQPLQRTPAPAARREMSYEELAQLSESVVQILVMDDSPYSAKYGDAAVKSSGSGIMIGHDGYILTNFHVVRGGGRYGVRIENEDEIYFTNRIVKYHDEYDLAVLRIDKKLSPLPIYRGGKKLVRGQKVVAIGSPLGLFNTVSDGIISGFRELHGLDMIQFTAPISSGSSGGAVLNMFGEVIGVSSAGLNNEERIAQNINLAVGYETILSFCANIIDR